ncbi:tRNA pseudouridine(55) synthase TruB [candidate division WOR-3 bacterium 4484_100]|uniref:tRNA pseudouridine synthase B n=1 Tax=candidate division WOR-3 bacterium 4484_100 TaxID=1936077 RepID=A0A1V4QH28_UNCW3|nr:MAG: tRNA pseudouridine(55) synthase TruB [candidate division WOR-3 bacterium 4484_100]
MEQSILLVDKPVGFSSFQIVEILKKRYKKVGHTGTLDPSASGLLIILINQATKRFEEFQKYEKEYEGEFILGMTSETYDIASPPLIKVENNKIGIEQLKKVSQEFVGEIQQIPPRFSALKYQGERLYKLVQKNVDITPAPRQVLVKSFEIIDGTNPIFRFQTVVGKGVYIRSLINDLGIRLGCGATLLSLRRLRIGDYHITQAKKIGELFD